jgi:hypothetical protein
MSTKPATPRIPLAKADRIAIAGSVRRRRPFVGDIELVCIPRLVPTGPFGDELITAHMAKASFTSVGS